MKKAFANMLLGGGLVYLLLFVHESTRWPVWGSVTVLAGAGAAALAGGRRLLGKRTGGGMLVLAFACALYLNYLSLNLIMSAGLHGYMEGSLIILLALRFLFLVGSAGLLFEWVRGA